MTIDNEAWVLVGEDGSYSDYHMWIVAVALSPAIAERLREQLIAEHAQKYEEQTGAIAFELRSRGVEPTDDPRKRWSDVLMNLAHSVYFTTDEDQIEKARPALAEAEATYQRIKDGFPTRDSRKPYTAEDAESVYSVQGPFPVGFLRKLEAKA